MYCPKCNSNKIVKNGRTRYGKQRFKCQNCGRQFVESQTRQPTDKLMHGLIDKLLLEQVSLDTISYITGVSPRWLENYVNQKYY
ncbi:IS1/IS1595 family N-terminal zinc-binding domain-containing protein [Umezakia ovalisporum]|jgi:transposase-like protein|uniref:IS1/IS1595 family N-terminal zinc-binding domain-containing protein n=1 Tax=Umezakia ovalisporum TaxID=75695 RepID=UPI00269795EB